MASETNVVEEIQRLEDIEIQEGDETKEDVYKFLLVFYLLDDQATKAKFLWKRIPSALKQGEASELNKLWKICQNLILRKYSQAFQFSASFNSQWTNQKLRQLVNRLVEKTKEDLFSLVSMAYSSISVHELSTMLNLSQEETVKISLSQNWTLDDTKTFLIPFKKQKETVKTPSSLKQLHQLTQIVSYIDT